VTNKSQPFNSLKFWISVLSALLIMLNLIIFGIYQKSHPDENLWKQLWNYLGSEPTKIVTVSIILPIIMLLLERIFKIRDVIGERIEARKQKRREARWQCIEETSKMWNELYGLVSDVVYYKPPTRRAKKEPPAKEEPHLEDTLKKLENLASSWNNIVNMWHHRFPNLSDTNIGLSFEDSVHYFIAMLFDSTFTIACYILKSSDRKKINDLQGTLGIIQDVVRSIVYHPMICILKDSMDLMDIDDPRKDQVQKDLKSCLEYLSESAKALRQEEIEHNEVFSSIKHESAKALREAFKKFEQFRREHPKEPIKSSDEYKKFHHIFHKIELENFIQGERLYYSLKWVKYLATCLNFVSALEHLKERAKIPK